VWQLGRGRPYAWETDGVAVPLPTDQSRWRCAQCGNLTRFDVTRTTRTREFVHVGLSGQAEVEERDVLADTVERVVCRWCNGVNTVEVVPRPDAAGAS
jgi:hypothetical protein